MKRSWEADRRKVRHRVSQCLLASLRGIGRMHCIALNRSTGQQPTGAKTCGALQADRRTGPSTFGPPRAKVKGAGREARMPMEPYGQGDSHARRKEREAVPAE